MEHIVTITRPFNGIKTKSGKFVEGPHTPEYKSVTYDQMEFCYDHFGSERSDLAAGRMEFGDVVRVIKSGALREANELVRSKSDRKERSFYKCTRLHSMFFGQFVTSLPAGRKTYQIEDVGLVQHAGLVCVDVDHILEKYDRVKLALSNDPLVHACFRSPSGDGIKIVVAVPFDAAQHHREYYQAVINYFNGRMPNTPVDGSCINPSRRCFVSHDPDAYYNPDSTVFTDRVKAIEHSSSPIFPAPFARKWDQDDNRSFLNAVDRVITGKRAGRSVAGIEFVNGSKHAFVVALAGMCKGFNISRDSFLSLAKDYLIDAQAVRSVEKIYQK